MRIYKKMAFVILLSLCSFFVLANSLVDQNIEQNFRAQMSGKPEAANIEMRVENGVIYLTGLVDTPLEREKIINIAEQIEHVQRVDSNIIVRGDKNS